MRVLVVEDDRELAGVLRDGLREASIDVTLAADFAEGRECATASSFDVLILDVLLPGGSGFVLCRELRAAGVTSPVLMLTALDAVDDRVQGLEAGADDYLTKPFAFRELAARVKVLARRRPVLADAVCRIANLEVDLARRTVLRAGKPIRLTAKEFALLELFVSRPGRVLDRSTITAHIWDDNHDPFANLLDVLVRRLRKKIDDPFTPKLIATVRGVGYRFGP